MRSVSVALSVLEVVADRQPVGVSEVARALDVPKSTAQRALTTLGGLGWIRTLGEESGRWMLTAKAQDIGARHLPDDELRQLAAAAMHWLSVQTGETVHLSVRHDRTVVLIEKVDGIHPVRTNTFIGGAAPLHATASGKAILAAMGHDEAEALLRAGHLESLTDDTVTEADRLLEELADIRRRGYALAVGTRHAEVGAVGAAVVGAAGRPIGSLSLSMPVHRLTRAQRPVLGALVRSAAASCGPASTIELPRS